MGTPVRILEGTTGTFKWDNLRQVFFRDHIQQAGFGETNRGSCSTPSEHPWRANTISGSP